MDEKNKINKLTPKQERFCQEYVNCLDGEKAAILAKYSKKTARFIASENLTKPNIINRLKELQKPLTKKLEITRERVLEEYSKIAFSSIAHLHNTWIELKEFNKLTEDQKTSIQEINTQIRKTYNDDGVLIETEYVKIKLYDKLKALDSVKAMLGFDAPIKTDNNQTIIWDEVKTYEANDKTNTSD